MLAKQLQACAFNSARLLTSRRWRELIAGIDSRRCAGGCSKQPRTYSELERRIGTIRARLRRDRAIRYQRSLFDGRADADADARRAIADRLDAALARTLRSVTSPMSVEASRLELIAAWPERRR